MAKGIRLWLHAWTEKGVLVGYSPITTDAERRGEAHWLPKSHIEELDRTLVRRTTDGAILGTVLTLAVPQWLVDRIPMLSRELELPSNHDLKEAPCVKG
jgi:hypothetical protein